jgi:ribosomal protein S18 acetylase RimI-like enzyme
VKSPSHPSPLVFRYEPTVADRDDVRRLVAATGVFSPVEIETAVELLDERLAKGPASGYEFVFVERDGRVAGYSCYGPIALTAASYDLFWIAVDKSSQGRGLGRAILKESERQIFGRGGRRVYIETSGRPAYHATRGFYHRCGYQREAVLKDFYAPGDDKVIYSRAMDQAP